MNKLAFTLISLSLNSSLNPADVYHYTYTNAKNQTKIVVSSKPPHYMEKRGYVFIRPSISAITPELSRILTIADNLSKKHGVCPWLTRAIIQAESSFNPKAVSRAGAMGLMQLMPQTATRFNVANPFDVAQNLEGGIKYLNWLGNYFNADYVKVIAAYNAGENAVDRHKGVPPFAETKHYVPKVLSLWQSRSVFPALPPIVSNKASLGNNRAPLQQMTKK